MRTLVTMVAILLAHGACPDYPPPRELYTLSWIGGPFVWPSTIVRSMYKTSGKFISKNMIATRAVIWRDQVFVVFPRYLPGVAATLASTSLLSPTYEAVFEPFPSWEAQAEGEPGALQNVVDAFLDRRDVLWVLDTGVTQTLDRPIRRCGPKVVGYNLITGTRAYKVDLTDLTSSSSRLQYIVVDCDTRGSSDRRYLYISDAGLRAIIVYNLAEESGYRIVLPESVTTGCSQSNPDVLYIALAKTDFGSRRLYITSLSGEDLFSVSTEDLQAGTNHGAVDRVSGHKPNKMVIIGTDNRGNIYFRYEGKTDIYSWNVNTDLEQENFNTVYPGDYGFLATHAVLDPLRSKMRILQSNFLDFFQRTVGVGAVHMLTAVS